MLPTTSLYSTKLRLLLLSDRSRAKVGGRGGEETVGCCCSVVTYEASFAADSKAFRRAHEDAFRLASRISDRDSSDCDSEGKVPSLYVGCTCGCCCCRSIIRSHRCRVCSASTAVVTSSRQHFVALLNSMDRYGSYPRRQQHRTT